MNYRFPAILAAAALCVGCPQTPRQPERSLPAASVEPDQIVGTWSLTTNALSLLARDGFDASAHETYTISIRQNGSLAFDTVLPSFRSGSYLSVEGTWALRTDAPPHTESRSLVTMTINLVTPDGRHERSLRVNRDKTGLLLWDYYGDPDEETFLEYRKAEPSDPLASGTLGTLPADADKGSESVIADVRQVK